MNSLTNDYILDSLKEKGFNFCKTIFIPPLNDRSILNNLPTNWSLALAEDLTIAEFIEKQWEQLKNLLPLTVALIKKKVQQLAITPDLVKGQYSLLYIFSEDRELRVRVGYLPTQFTNNVLGKLYIDLSPLYSTHDGFVDLISQDAGFLSLENIEIYKDLETGIDSFLKVFGVGTNSLGFDLESKKSDAYILWGGDADVEAVDDFWSELDEWMASEIEDFDDRVSAA